MFVLNRARPQQTRSGYSTSVGAVCCRFRVRQEMIRPDKLDPGTTVKGLDYIDVPGHAKRDYKLTFYAHKEGTTHMKVPRRLWERAPSCGTHNGSGYLISDGDLKKIVPTESRCLLIQPCTSKQTKLNAKHLHQTPVNTRVYLCSQVIFTNESSGEYQWFEVTFKTRRPEALGTVALTTPVRQAALHALRVTNPLAWPVTFSASCSVSEVLLPAQLIVPANSEVRVHNPDPEVV